MGDMADDLLDQECDFCGAVGLEPCAMNCPTRDAEGYAHGLDHYGSCDGEDGE